MLRKLSWGAPGRVPSFFFAPGGLQERSWTRLGVDLARNRAPRAKQRVLGALRGQKMSQIRPPRALKKQVFVWNNCKNQENRLFAGETQKRAPTWPPGAPPGAPGGAPGGPVKLNNGPKSGPRRPQEAPSSFFSPPGPPRAATRSDLRRSWRPPWADMAPRSAPEASEPSFGALRVPSGSFFSSFL